MNQCSSKVAEKSCGKDAGIMQRKLTLLAVCPSAEYLRCDDLGCKTKDSDVIEENSIIDNKV